MLPSFDSLRLTEAPGATVVVDLDGQIVDWSKGAEELFGYASDEALGHSFVDLVVPAEQQREERPMLDEVESKGNSTYMSTRRRKDGSLINVLVSSKAIPDDLGKPAYVISTKTDVTHLVVQRDNRVVVAKYGELLDSVPDAVVMVNGTGRIVYANSKAEILFGYDHSELIGHQVEFLLPPRFKAGHVGFRNQYIAHARPRAMGAGLELAGLKRDGTEFPVEISLSLIQTEGGTLVMSAIRDITDRKEIERALYEKNVELLTAADAKNKFLANMSHELRTPLNGIIGFTEFMLDGKPGPLNAKQEEYLSDVLCSGRHLLQLINDVLDLAKVEAGKMELHPEQFSLSKAISEVCAVVKPATQKKSLEFTTDVTPAADIVKLDQQRIKQVLYNFLSNAIKFSKNFGKIGIIAMEGVPGELLLSVSDEGIGIKPEDLARLFKEFEQLDSGVGRKYEGTGLGLALTRSIVELHGGSISVESQVDHGSTFSVSIPGAIVGPE